jgi:hypothetical protein
MSTHRKSLNTKQLAILDLLYRFRFGTTDLFTKALEVNHKTKMNERLKILLDQEYIGRHYEPEYRLLRKHASYYLLPKGMKALRELDTKYDETILRNSYKDKTASDQFINHNLTIFKTYCDLKVIHGDKLKFFTKSQLKPYDYFPHPLPDAYFRIETDKQPKQYFLEALESSRPFFVSVRKARRYIAYSENGEWDDTETELPTVILVCDSGTLKRRMDKQVEKIASDIDPDELSYLATIDIIDAFNRRNLSTTC